MTRGIRPITTSDLNVLLSQVIEPQLLEVLSRRRSGHCMRVTDLSTELAHRVCAEVRREQPEAEVYVLPLNLYLDSLVAWATSLACASSAEVFPSAIRRLCSVA